MLDGNPDETFAEALQEMGAASFEQLQAARKSQAEKNRTSASVSLAEVLVEQGVITVQMRENVEKKLQAQQAGARHLGPYKLIKKLGEGGMGAVFLAEDTQAGRPCALKVLRKDFSSSPEFLTRFRREAVATGKLNHPNIVMAYTVGDERGVHYYAMEYCEGHSLEVALARGIDVPWQVAVDVISQVAEGLDHAHEHGIIHRDIKPANIFICRPPGTEDKEAIFPEGFVAKILDLGLSKTLATGAESSFLTQTGTTLGTPHYISPEQAQGDKEIDGRADIYSLGATLYHLLTHRTPFKGSTAAAVIMQHIRQNVPDPKDANPTIPSGLSLVIRRMMAKKPDDRYENCGELLDDLEQVLDGQMPAAWQGEDPKPPPATSPTTSLPPPQPTTVSVPSALDATVLQPRKENSPFADRRVLIGVAAAGVLGVLILIFLLTLPGRTNPQANRAAELRLQKEREKAQAALEEAERAKREAEKRAREAAKRQEADNAANLKALEELQRKTEESQRQLEEAIRQAAQKKQQTPVAKSEPVPAQKPVPTTKEAPATKNVPERPAEGTRKALTDRPPPGPADEPGPRVPRGPEPALLELERWANDVLQQTEPEKPPALYDVSKVKDVEGLKRTRGLLIRQLFAAQDANQRAVDNETATRNRVAALERRMKAPQHRPTHTVRPGPVRPPPPPRDRPWLDRQKDQNHLNALRDQHEKAKGEAERTEEVVKSLTAARDVVTDRLRTLGVADLAMPEGAPKKASPYKIYVLKDGTELKAYMAVNMGEKTAIRDEDGETRMVPTADIKEIRKGP